MYNFKTLKCSNCNTVIANLPEIEIAKLNGLTFTCDCCNQSNILKGFKFRRYLRGNSISTTNTLKEQILA